jgi:hypothetical protein
MIQILTIFLSLAHANVNPLPPLHLLADYMVPAEGVQEGTNHFQITRYTIDRSLPGKEVMSFDLHEDLTGGDTVTIEMTVKTFDPNGPQGPTRTLEGRNGAAECVGAWTALKCDYEFRRLNIKKLNQKNFLSAKYAGSPLLNDRLRVGETFLSDPIGVAKTRTFDSLCVNCRSLVGIKKLRFETGIGSVIVTAEITPEGGNYWGAVSGKLVNLNFVSDSLNTPSVSGVLLSGPNQASEFSFVFEAGKIRGVWWQGNGLRYSVTEL